MSTEMKRVQGTVVIWVVATLLVGACLWTRVFQSIENTTWDWRLRSIASASKNDPRVKIITVDQSSLEYVSREMGIGWPWPRSIYNPVLEFLAASGARAVAFDLLFTEHSNEAHDDEQFAQVVRRSVPVISAVALQRRAGGESEESMKLFMGRQESDRKLIEGYLIGDQPPVFPNAALPIDELIRASSGFGNVTSTADGDQIIRHTEPGAYLGSVPVLSLPFALHSIARSTEDSVSWLKEYHNQQGQLLVRYYGPASTFQTYSLSAVLSSAIRISEGEEPKIPLAEFKDAYVFIGASAPGLLDLRPVPFKGAFPGVELNATVFNNLLDRSFLRSAPFGISSLVSLSVLGIASLLGGFLKRGGLVAQGVWMLVWIGACYVVAHLGWWLPMVAPLVGLVFVIVATGFLQYQLEGRQHRFIRKAFKHYMSPEVIEQIVKDPSKLRLGGDRRELTIFFSDIQGFTGISERLPPDQLVQFLNRFLSEMSKIILESGGTLDKYQGDAVIAFWNAPLPVEDHRQRAVLAALRCQQRLRELAPEFERAFGIQPRMRIGIHTGVVSVGNFGSDLRFNYTMIGDAANVASRLEGVNKVFGTYTLVSEVTRDVALDSVTWRKLGSVKVVGRKEPVVVYQPLDNISDAALVRNLSTYHDALALFEEGKLREARGSFERLGDDPVCVAYRARIERMINSENSETSVWDVKEK